MKKYEKPNLDIKSVTANETISSSGLQNWLEGNSDIDSDVGITTYHLESM